MMTEGASERVLLTRYCRGTSLEAAHSTGLAVSSSRRAPEAARRGSLEEEEEAAMVCWRRYGGGACCWWTFIPAEGDCLGEGLTDGRAW